MMHVPRERLIHWHNYIRTLLLECDPLPEIGNVALMGLSALNSNNPHLQLFTKYGLLKCIPLRTPTRRAFYGTDLFHKRSFNID